MWCEAGHAPDSFWGQTPRTFAIVMKAARARNKSQYELAVTTAWHVAAFNARTKTKEGLKPLKKYIGEETEQTPEMMLDELRAMGAKSDMKITFVPAEDSERSSDG